jgi:hypothetical protein
MYPSATADWVTRKHSSFSTDIAKFTQANLRYTNSPRFQYRSLHTYIHELLIPIFSNMRARIPTIHTLTPPRRPRDVNWESQILQPDLVAATMTLHVPNPNYRLENKMHMGLLACIQARYMVQKGWQKGWAERGCVSRSK